MRNLNFTGQRAPSLKVAVTLLSLFAINNSAVAAQAEAQGTIWGNYNSGPNVVFANDYDAAFPPDSLASVSNSYSANGFTFEYSASAGISSGALKVYARASSDGGASGTYDSVSGSGIPSTFARVLETLTFTPSDSDPYTVSFTLAVDGSYVLAPSSSGFSFANLSISQQGGGNSDFDEVQFLPSVNPIFELLTAELTLQGSQMVDLSATLSAQILDISGSNQFSEFDFANTAQLGINVPASVAVTSTSGFFLATAVPLPASVWLMTGALFGLFRLGKTRSAA